MGVRTVSGAASGRNGGCVYLVGAGPGDPRLATEGAIEALSRADVVICDYLADDSLLEHVSAGAKVIDVGKKGFREHLTQDDINELIVSEWERLADSGRSAEPVVVRLKGGDPFVFGRGGEEALFLVEAGIPFEVIPGITSGIAAPAYAGIPVTHRGLSSSVTFVTGNEDPTKEGSSIDWGALAELASAGGTLCIYMGVRNLRPITEGLISAGLDPDEHAALIRWGTRAGQRTLASTVMRIADDATHEGFEAPCILVIGKVVGLRDELDWYETLPLFGRSFLVTRSRKQTSSLSRTLRRLGAQVRELPTIEIHPMVGDEALDRALLMLGQYDWVAFTSANGVEAAFDELRRLGLDARAFGSSKVAAIGQATAERLRQKGIVADVVPDAFVGEELARAMVADGPAKGRKTLILRASEARDALPEMLRDAGMDVDVVACYETRIPYADTDEVINLISEVDSVTFTSSSTVRNLLALIEHATGDDPSSILAGKDLFSIGPITTSTLEDAGFERIVEAHTHDIPGLVEAIAEGCPAESGPDDEEIRGCR